jgi:hypothetical protein
MNNVSAFKLVAAFKGKFPSAVIPKSHYSEKQIVFLPLCEQLSLNIAIVFMFNGHFNELVCVHSVNNFQFPAVPSLC